MRHFHLPDNTSPRDPLPLTLTPPPFPTPTKNHKNSRLRARLHLMKKIITQEFVQDVLREVLRDVAGIVQESAWIWSMHSDGSIHLVVAGFVAIAKNIFDLVVAGFVAIAPPRICWRHTASRSRSSSPHDGVPCSQRC